MAPFDELGFRWDRDLAPRKLPHASLGRAVFRFHRMLPEYVWDAGVLEGNPFTFPEVKTLLDGVTVGGRKLSDQEQILNLAESSKYLIGLVKRREFKLDKSTFCAIHTLVARNEALEWGHFRGEGPETRFTPDVALGPRGRFTPLPTEPGAVRLNEVFSRGVQSLEQHVSNPFERATAFFLFGALQQFFFDGNKRTSRFMMNGMLMSKGLDAVSIPAVRAAEFNSKMVNFYTTRDATEMMAFVLECHPSLAEIRQLNPDLPGVSDAPSIKYFSIDDSMKPTDPNDLLAGERAEGPDAPQTADSMQASKPAAQEFSLEDVRRKAREDWLRDYYGKGDNTNEPGAEEKQSRTRNSEPGKDAGVDRDSE